MGRNVSCAASGISIGQRDEVVFIPLAPSEMQKGKHILDSCAYLPTAYELFTPFCLPIEGKYCEDTGLYDIKADANAKALERLFGMEAEEFAQSVGMGMPYFDPKRAIADMPFSMESMGFREEKGALKNGTLYKHGDLPLFFVFPKGSFSGGYKIFDVSGDAPVCLIDREFSSEDTTFADDFESAAGKPLFESRVVNPQGLSGMYVLKSVYDQLAEFQFGREDEYTRKELEKAHQSFSQKLKNHADEAKEYEDDIAQTDSEDRKQRYRERLERHVHYYHPMSGGEMQRNQLCLFFQDMHYFKDLYADCFGDKALKQSLINFVGFSLAFRASNKMFFPAYKGEQFGDDEASKALLDISAKALEKRIEKQNS